MLSVKLPADPVSYDHELFLYGMSYVFQIIHLGIPEAYSEPCQMSKMKFFVKIVNGF